MLRFGTLVSRIVWLHMAAVTVAVVAMIASIHLLLNAILAAFEHKTLSEHAVAIAQAVQPLDAGLAIRMPPELRDLYAHGYGGFSFAVLDKAGQTLFSSLPSGGSLFPRDPKNSTPTYFQRTQGPVAYYGVSYPQHVGGRDVWIQVTQNLQHPDVFADDVVAQFLRQILWLIVPIITLLLLADILIVRRALLPVLAASKHAGSIHPNRIDVRLPTTGLPDEVVPLVTAMNQALDRIEAGFRTQRDFTADVAHELRTPLAILRLRVDGLADVNAASLLRADIDAMSRMVEQLLALTELETFTLAPTDRADLRAVGLEVAGFMAPAAISSGKQVAVSVGDAPIWVHGEAEALFRALRNLVENGLAHSPASGVVSIDITPGIARISDQGPGVPESEHELILQRFWRRDRRSLGSGLGLNIVARIVHAHGGELTIETAPGGGACFVLKLRPWESIRDEAKTA